MLFLHVFVLIMLVKSNYIPPPSTSVLNSSVPYMLLVPIASDQDSARALRSGQSAPSAIIKNFAATSMAPIIDRAISKAERSDKPMTSTQPPPQPDDGGTSKPGKILDYDAIKRTARAIAHEMTDRPLPGARKRRSDAEKFEDAVGHAKRGDCSTEYAHLGILAIPFLLKDTVTDRGCKW